MVIMVILSCWNMFQPQINPMQNRGTFLWTVISKTWARIIRSKIVFFIISNISATRSHAQFIFRTVVQQLWTFFRPWGRDLSQSPLFKKSGFFRVKRIQQSTASKRTLPGYGYTQVGCWVIPAKNGAFIQCRFNVGPPSSTLVQHLNRIGWIPRISWPGRGVLNLELTM